jgi:hypothetical protein
LTRAAADLLEAAGHSAAPATLHRVTRTLLAASPGALTDGLFTKDLEPTGLEGWGESIAPATETPPKEDVRARRRAEELDEQARAAEMKAADLERDARRALDEAKEIEAAAKKARREAVRARERADSALARVRT